MYNPWTEKERKALEHISTLEEAADIATTILARMDTNGHPVVQICGPMSTGGLGDFRKNMARFERAISRACEHGLMVFNQLPFQNAIIRIVGFDESRSTEYCMDILEVFYKRIFISGHIKKTLFLPDWQSSRGAVWERQIVAELGICIEDYPVEWLE